MIDTDVIKTAISTAIIALDKANQLTDIACDWNLDEVEIDGEMVKTRSLTKIFDTATAKLRAAMEGK